MNASELKYRVESAGHDSHFFTRNNMRFAGDTMRNYGVRSQPMTLETYSGPVRVWVLYRKRAVKYGLKSDAYFNCDTYAQEFAKV